ncbi:FadR/GntR family transcriptional regulator [Aquipuribacter hungaricus]|uniref:FadR/GntR family transcriptional regulator n=1 Tax=Aquipuribacter hungaricus TaxID=545624 RepID=A0ABV7WGE9_9MICO
MNDGTDPADRPLPRPPTLADAVTARFHAAIASGEWPVGRRIPVEADLMAWVGAGRNTVREAVSSLVQSGLVRREQGRGTFVIARSSLVTSLSRRAGRAARRDVLELRAAVDGAASAVAARRRDSSDVTALQEALGARTRAWAGDDRAARVAADVALHRAVVVATHNELLVEVWDGLVPLYEEVLADDVDPDEDPHADEHEQLVRAVVERDPDRAAAAVHAVLGPLLDALAEPDALADPAP